MRMGPELFPPFGILVPSPQVNGGIYEVQGDTPRLCDAMPGDSFPTDLTPGWGRHVLIFKRIGEP